MPPDGRDPGILRLGLAYRRTHGWVRRLVMTGQAMHRACNNARSDYSANHCGGVIALRRRGAFSTVKLRWRSVKVLLLPGAELLCRLLMLGTHIAPGGLFFGLVCAVPCRPVGIVRNMALPLHPLRRKIGAPIAPGIGIDRQMRA